MNPTYLNFSTGQVLTSGPEKQQVISSPLVGLHVEGAEMIVMAAKLNFTNCSSVSHGGGFHSDKPLKQEMGQIHFRFLDVKLCVFFVWGWGEKRRENKLALFPARSFELVVGFYM